MKPGTCDDSATSSDLLDAIPWPIAWSALERVWWG
jgi:hypothetical protein